MADQEQFTDKQLEILHDHYKETFARLREAEALRDRLFLWLIGLFALLILEIGYPSAVGGALGKLTIAGEEIDLHSLPLPALLSASWVLTLTVGLRYCQTSILVNRQYPYLHKLEERISPQVGGGDMYQREGAVYLRDYPLLLDVAWITYGVLFPLLVMGVAFSLSHWEVNQDVYSFGHSLFDALIAFALIVFFFLYRVYPAIIDLPHKAKKWRQSLEARYTEWQAERERRRKQDEKATHKRLPEDL